MIENPMSKMRASLRVNDVHGAKPEDVDLRRLLICFVIDGKAVTIGDEANSLHGWGDMQTAPVVDDIVLRRAIGVDEDGYATVKARVWQCYNWLWIYLERYPETTGEGDDDGE